ncbi:phage tail assembly chaperone [Bradyrhizobium elkanii]|uniref:phage tail assembly chaperone n=1 Tax=Bradyrhizobium elkanii TaxID=29448 RepID=UPI003F7EB487
MKVSDEIANRPPEFPHAISHVWIWFNEVIRGVQGNGYSYPVVTWNELYCWAQMTRQEISAREARTIIVLGTMHANIMSEKPKTNGGKG